MTKMYKKVEHQKSSIATRNAIEGETIEEKVERIISNKEQIRDGAPLIYTERSEGVNASYNPRTDRFEIALDATTKIEKSYKAKRENNANLKAEKGGLENKELDSIQGNADNGTV